jgi:serine/threonine protein kinase
LTFPWHFVTFVDLLKSEMLLIEVPRNSVTLGIEIGQGEFGVVMKGVAVGLRGSAEVHSVAVKVMRASLSQSDANAFLREGLRLHELHHPKVVRLLGVCLTSQPYLLIFEYMVYGDLKSLLRSCVEQSVQLGIDHLLKFASDALEGFLYLQRKQFVHRDLAARNVLVNAHLVAKIGDFGMARRQYHSDYYKESGTMTTSGPMVLPIRWMAPESFFDGTWTMQSDVWMFGVLLWGLS